MAEEEAVLRESGEADIAGAKAKAKAELDELDVILNIAVTGESGSGKSSFVNAIRGVEDWEEGAAPTGEVETTTEPKMYLHPKMPNIRIWDLPGVGTLKFPADKYIKEMKFTQYDFFLILSAGRITENDINLAKEIKKKKKNFYFIRTKIDVDVKAAKRRRQAEAITLSIIRKECEEKLEALGPAPIFLIASHELEKFELNKLLKALETDLPDHKMNALIQSLPVYSMQILDQKYQKFKKTIWALALTSGAVAAVPLPGVSLAFDIPLIFTFLTKVYYSFGLDDASLKKLSERINKPILAEKRKSPLIQALAGQAMQGLAKSLSAIVIAGGVESALSFVPIVGSIAGAGTSFVTTLVVLRKALKELYNAAKEVVQMAGLDK